MSEPEEDYERAVFCDDGGMHCASLTNHPDDDYPMTAWADDQHPAGAPHRVAVRRVLTFPWERA